MQIFILSLCPKECARFHANKHVVKCILESCQLMCTAHHILDSNTELELYRVTHKNHPCAVWIRKSIGNYIYLYNLFYFLCKEYTYRYSKVHLCEKKFIRILSTPPKNTPNDPYMTPFAQAMPVHIKILHDEPIYTVIAYRNYYKQNKRHICTWKRETPYWYL